MLKLGRMHRQTEEKFVDPTAMSRQMRSQTSRVCKFKQPSTDKHPWPSKNRPEDGHGTAQMGNTTTRLITSW